MDKNVIKRFFNEKYIDDRNYGKLGGEYDPPEVLFVWTDLNGDELASRIEFNGDIEKELEAYELKINPDDDRVHSSFMKNSDLSYLLECIFDKLSTKPSPEQICIIFNQHFAGSVMSLKLFLKEDYFEPGYSNRKYDTENNLGYIQYKLNSSKTKFTVKDLKTFLRENNVPDDAVLKICYEDCCESVPSKLLHDRNTNEFVIIE